jgi:hypothetical protein
VHTISWKNLDTLRDICDENKYYLYLVSPEGCALRFRKSKSFYSIFIDNKTCCEFLENTVSFFLIPQKNMTFPLNTFSIGSSSHTTMYGAITSSYLYISAIELKQECINWGAIENKMCSYSLEYTFCNP